MEGVEAMLANIKSASESIKTKVKEQVFDSANAIRNEARSLVPVKTARLKNSIGVNFDNAGFSATISTDVEYAQSIEYGSRPHVIEVKNAKVLTDGVHFFGKKVNHPGNRPMPFMNPAMESERSNFINGIKEALK